MTDSTDILYVSYSIQPHKHSVSQMVPSSHLPSMKSRLGDFLSQYNITGDASYISQGSLESQKLWVVSI